MHVDTVSRETLTLISTLTPVRDFDRKVIVKVNAGELVRRELAAPRWRGAHVAMGTNVDCYQRAEGRYRLMPQIIGALRDFANPFSILTKGTLILRDLPLLRQAAEVTTVGISFSVGFVDEHALAHRRAGHAAPPPPAGRGPGARRRGLLRRRADGPDPARPHRHRRVDRGHRVGDRRRRRDQRDRRCPCTCVPAPGSGTRTGSPASTRSWCPATASSTGPARTPRRRTSGS